jgi:hypothetical protein
MRGVGLASSCLKAEHTPNSLAGNRCSKAGYALIWKARYIGVSPQEETMTEQELEAQCMPLTQVIDTEVVPGDPLEIASFDASTLYVWLVPGPPRIDPRDSAQHTNLVRGRLGQRDAVAASVSDVATMLGVRAARGSSTSPS